MTRRSRRKTTGSRGSTRRSKATSTRRPERVPGRGPRYRLIAGKGGVGKTTCAAGIAAHAARAGLRTLVISTDPAPSLGDAFRQALSDAPRRVPEAPGCLYAVEIDAPRALDRWLRRRRGSLERIAARGTWLDDDDIARLLRLSLPGIDEIAALLELLRFGRSGRFDFIVIDTAPTGHALRMLALPRMLGRLAALFDAMQAKHRTLAEALRGYWEPDAEDALILELENDARELHALLRDTARLETWWVTLPEPMAIEESADGLAALRESGIPVERIVVNRLTQPPSVACDRCDARRAFEARAVTRLRGISGNLPLVGLAAREREPRGAAALARVGEELAAAAGIVPARRPRQPHWRAAVEPGDRQVAAALATDATRLLLFGGKGGVGKTTCAAAAAIHIAGRSRGRRVLLLSTDPAHSLGDLLGTRISDVARPVPGAPPGLLVRELDAARRFEELHRRYAAAVDALFDGLSRRASIDARQDRAVMTDLLDLAPPGIDELMAVAEVTEALAAPRLAAGFDVVVMDMAPSGHALRLLQTPAVVQGWARAFMAILLKYQAVVGIGELGATLLRLSRDLGRLRDLLRDPLRTRFVVVTRGAALPLAETARLILSLAELDVQVPALVVNAAGRGTCARCRREAASERREIASLRRLADREARRLVIAPGQVPPPRGAEDLRRWVRRWR